MSVIFVVVFVFVVVVVFVFVVIVMTAVFLICFRLDGFSGVYIDEGTTTW